MQWQFIRKERGKEKKSHDGTERELFDIFLIRETRLQHTITQMRNPESGINPIPNRRSSRSTPFLISCLSFQNPRDIFPSSTKAQNAFP